MGLCGCIKKGEHRPSLSIKEGLDREAVPGSRMEMTAEAESSDGSEVSVSFRIYVEAGSACSKKALLETEGNRAFLTVPEDAEPGEEIHVICRARAAGHYRLTCYRQVIIRVLQE